MSRWIAVRVLIAVPAVASAKVVVMRETISNACPGGTWSAVQACFASHHWKPRVVRAFPHAELVDFGDLPADAQLGVPRAVMLYTGTAGGPWRLAGEYTFDSNDAVTVLAAMPIVVGTSPGFRIDIGNRVESSGSPQLELWKIVLYCSVNGTGMCTEITPECEAISDGHVTAVFHGAIVLDQRTVRVVGDRRLAATVCQPNASVMKLDWP